MRYPPWATYYTKIGSPWKVNISGDYFVAEDPLKYFKELRVNHRRYEEEEEDLRFNEPWRDGVTLRR